MPKKKGRKNAPTQSNPKPPRPASRRQLIARNSYVQEDGSRFAVVQYQGLELIAAPRWYEGISHSKHNAFITLRISSVRNRELPSEDPDFVTAALPPGRASSFTTLQISAAKYRQLELVETSSAAASFSTGQSASNLQSGARQLDTQNQSIAESGKDTVDYSAVVVGTPAGSLADLSQARAGTLTSLGTQSTSAPQTLVESVRRAQVITSQTRSDQLPDSTNPGTLLTPPNSALLETDSRAVSSDSPAYSPITPVEDTQFDRSRGYLKSVELSEGDTKTRDPPPPSKVVRLSLKGSSGRQGLRSLSYSTRQGRIESQVNSGAGAAIVPTPTLSSGHAALDTARQDVVRVPKAVGTKKRKARESTSPDLVVEDRTRSSRAQSSVLRSIATQNATTLKNMAPVQDPNDVSNKIKDVIHNLYDIQNKTHGYIPETQELLVDRIGELADSLAGLRDLSDPSISPNNPIQSVRVAPEIVDYVDQGRNPDIFSREFVETVQRGNAVMNGKKQAFRDFSVIFAQKLKEGIGGVDKHVDQIMDRAGLSQDLEEAMRKSAEDEQPQSRLQENGASK